MELLMEILHYKLRTHRDLHVPSQVPPPPQTPTVSYQHFFMSKEQSTCTSPQPDLVFLQLFPNDIQTKRILLTTE
jgi:hypothetical protein